MYISGFMPHLYKTAYVMLAAAACLKRTDTVSISSDTLNQSSFCGKRLKYRGFWRKNNLKSAASALLQKGFRNDVGNVSLVLCPVFRGKRHGY